MQFQVARLQEIINKIQFNCKLNFKNAIDIALLLEVEGFDLFELNNLISAGVKIVGFKKWQDLTAYGDPLLPVRKHYLGDLNDVSLEQILSRFEMIEAVLSLDQAEKISHQNAYKARVSDVLLRVNVINNDSKYGFLPAEVMEAFLAVSKLSGVRVRGISAYIPAFSKGIRLKQILRKLKVMFTLLQNKYWGVEILSINVQDNWGDLIAEGVNELRITSKELKSQP